jgi:maleylpyruvate isomerase
MTELPGLRLHAIPFSTNVERVLLALGLKGVAEVEVVQHDPADRSALRALSGQELVPVLEAGDALLTDSMPIVAWLEERIPEPALWPADPAGRRAVQAFVAHFNHVWKVAPNAIADGVGDAGAWAAQLRGFQHGFEGLLAGRDFLFGATPSAADVCAYPFLKFGASTDPEDDDLFHGVLIEHLAFGDDFPNLLGWVARMAALPQARPVGTNL